MALSLSSSLNGFDDNRDAFGAVGNYSELPPSGTAAAALELPIRNRAARARNKQAHLKATRLLLQYEDQIFEVRRDVDTAIRQLNSLGPKISNQYESLHSRENEIDALVSRIWINPQEGASVVLQLEQLFQAVNRLVRTQEEIVRSKILYERNWIELEKAKGTLVRIAGS